MAASWKMDEKREGATRDLETALEEAFNKYLKHS